MSTCQICVNNITTKLNKPIQCPTCLEVCCKKCFVIYINQSGSQPLCMFCKKKPITMDFIKNELPASTFNAYQKYRFNIFIQNEKSLLPITQLQINQSKIQDRIQFLYSQIHDVNNAKKAYKDELLRQYKFSIENINNEFFQELQSVEESDEDISIIEFNRNMILTKYQEIIEKRLQERNDLYLSKREEYLNLIHKFEFQIENLTIQLNDDRIEKCYINQCRGYISSQTHICSTCNNLFCGDCHEIKNDDHICNKELVETLIELKKDSKPCPKCGVYINKVDGCDQIFCVVPTCQAVFSFSTGLLEKGNIHNPEYYRFLRDRNNGQIPENECVQLPTSTELSHYVIENVSTIQDANLLKHYYFKTKKLLEDIRYLEQTFDLETLRRQYLNNHITEMQWTRKLQKKETNEEILQILNTICKILLNYFHALITDNIDLQTFFKQSVQLIDYTNEELKNVTSSKKYFIHI